jgi:hypothetical protein
MTPTGTYVIELQDRENTSWRFHVPADMVGAYVGTVVDAYLDSLERKPPAGLRLTIEALAAATNGKERRRCDG